MRGIVGFFNGKVVVGGGASVGRGSLCVTPIVLTML